jgi:outer membrane lipopolysaccharide assembly protein LptE/RlpB
MEDEGMKKLVVLIFMVLFLASCGQHFTKSEYLQHDTMYKNWDHMKFSWFGPDEATSQDVEKSKEQQWWGIEVPYVPGQ